MNVEERYPGAPNAVIFCECLTSWDMYRRTAEQEGIDALHEHMRGSFNSAIKTYSDREDEEAKGRLGVLRQALAEWDHPDVKRYLCDKLGMRH